MSAPPKTLIDLREVCIGHLNYAIAVFRVGNAYSAAWSCDLCLIHRDEFSHGPTIDDAIMRTEAAVRAHHTALHRGD
jgi:hypothetical protein